MTYVFDHAAEVNIQAIRSDDGLVYVSLQLPTNPFVSSPEQLLALAMDLSVIATKAATGTSNPSQVQVEELRQKALAILQPDPRARAN